MFVRRYVSDFYGDNVFIRKLNINSNPKKKKIKPSTIKIKTDLLENFLTNYLIPVYNIMENTPVSRLFHSDTNHDYMSPSFWDREDIVYPFPLAEIKVRPFLNRTDRRLQIRIWQQAPAREVQDFNNRTSTWNGKKSFF